MELERRLEKANEGVKVKMRASASRWKGSRKVEILGGNGKRKESKRAEKKIYEQVKNHAAILVTPS